MFDENAMLHSKKESIAIDKDHGVHKQVELEIRPSVHPSHGDTLV